MTRFVTPDRVKRALTGLVVVLLLVACKSAPQKFCKVNDQCFVCPDDAAVQKCFSDPTTSRCKWTPPSNCK